MAIEQSNELGMENEAEARFKDAIHEFEGADAALKAGILVDAENAARAIEDAEKQAEALAQVEQLRETL